jgi:hypothetical protein
MSIRIRPIYETEWPVYEFCQKHFIECSPDFDNKYTWTEIYFKGEAILQFQNNTTVEQFLKIINLLYQKIPAKQIKVDGDFFWSYTNRKKVRRFIEKHLISFIKT